ncbi:hypothetical protein RD792_017911 [Penstemon davidsonii]|uniref:Phytocyanin domain-containing protein n=1 Tax=Penstemon davidsonii TaxID=160366 RepID=A0ABR0DVH1_9LAMI|nr:hypothetical protein RD792_017911 [Penstemon davidsonii]
MAMKAMILMFIIVIICGVSKGEVYKISWTNTGNQDYKSWAASKNFHVGDQIVFEYNKEFHNVVRVTHKNFNVCNSTAPYATWATGNDTFAIKKTGHYYFICSVPGHCQGGQKVDIRVAGNNNGPAPSPLPSVPSPKSPTPSKSPSPSSLSPPVPGAPGPLAPGPSPAAVAPSPHKNGSSSLDLSWKLWALVLAFGLKAIAF